MVQQPLNPAAVINVHLCSFKGFQLLFLFRLPQERRIAILQLSEKHHLYPQRVAGGDRGRHRRSRQRRHSRFRRDRRLRQVEVRRIRAQITIAKYSREYSHSRPHFLA